MALRQPPVLIERYKLARTRKTLMSQKGCDIVIVGAVAGRCVVASYLAEHTDASVALIEAGDTDRDPFIKHSRRLRQNTGLRYWNRGAKQ